MADTPAMPADIIVERSRSRGDLAAQYYLIRSEPAAALTEITRHTPDHLKYLNALVESGAVYLAGPVFSADGHSWHGGGLIVVAADSPQAARDIAAADPMHSSGVRTFTVEPWLINHAAADQQI